MPITTTNVPALSAMNAYGASLADPELLRRSSFVNGQWLARSMLPNVRVSDPATGEQIGFVDACSAADVKIAISHAHAAFAQWRALLPQERAQHLRNWAKQIEDNAEDLALIMVREQGKPISECRDEIAYARSFVEWFAEEAKRVKGEHFSSHLSNRQTFVSREPIGVAAAITPWNFPSAMVTRKAAAALAAGCTMIVKPAPETPFSALALAVLAQRAGIPAGVFNVVVGDAAMIGEEMSHSPLVRALSFTGSSRVGKILLAQSATTVKRVSLELGGHAPFLVFADADLERTVNDAISAKFQTSGQDCLAANRFLVDERVYDVFVERFTQRVMALRVGTGLAENIDIGPLIHSRAVDHCTAQVKDALAHGARLMVGGQRHAAGKAFMQPTVLADIDERMSIWSQETFGPVAAITSFASEEEALRRANDSEYGLAAYVFTQDSARSLRVSEQLQYGMVAVNTAQFTGAPVPFGGVKQSGLGREGSAHGLEEYTELKYRCVAV